MARASKAAELTVRDDTPLGKAFNKGQLDAGGVQYTAWDRYTAGRKYCALWDAIHGMCSSGALRLRVSSSFRPGGEPERKTIARDLFNELEGRLTAHARYILRAFLAEGASGSEAVSARLAGFEKNTWHAICLHLDELIDVMLALGAHHFPNV
jgi:hypothetical protein